MALTPIDRNGSFKGYNVALTAAVPKVVSVPVVASGGAGDYAHMTNVLRNGDAAGRGGQHLPLPPPQGPGLVSL